MKPKGVWIALWLLLAWLCPLAPARAEVLELTQATVTATVDGEASVTSAVTLPYHWDRQHGTQPGEAVFEIRFHLGAEPSRPFGLYLARIGNTAEIRLNGLLLARDTEMDIDNGADYAKAPRYLTVPPRLLQADNLLSVHIQADGARRGGLSSLVIGPAEEVHPLYAQAWFWRVGASGLVATFSVLVGVIALALWLTQTDPGNLHARRRDRIYLFAGLAELCWALRVGDVAIDQPPLPWPAWGVVVTAAFAGWICCIALFCHHVAGWQRARSMPWFAGWLALLFLASIPAAFASMTLYEPVWLTAWLGVANLFFIGYALVYLSAALRRPTPARLMVALVGGFNVMVGVRDWVAIRLSGDYETSTWIRYSSVLFGLVLGYIVVTRFREASAQARDLMDNLSARVAQKEAELQQTYQRLEHLAREQGRAGERTRILRDMHDGVGAHISSAIRQLQSGKASNTQVLQTLRDSLDQLKLSIDSMNLPRGDVTALLANLRYRLEPRLAASDIELQWDVDLLEPLHRLDAHAMRQLQFMVFEALSNVLQHAGASVLRIEAHAREAAAGPGGKSSGYGAGVELRITDNGRGYDTAQPLRRGLLSLQERAVAIGARLTLFGEPGRTGMEIWLARHETA